MLALGAMSCNGQDNSAIFRAKMPARDLLHNYTLWALRHVRDTKSSKLDIKVPFIDIYDAFGRVIYHGDDAASNAAVLSGMPNILASLASPSSLGSKAVFPSLQEMVDMIPAFRDRFKEIQGRKDTVLSVTLTGCAPCAPQDAGIAKLRSREEALDVRVLEVELVR